MSRYLNAGSEGTLYVKSLLICASSDSDEVVSVDSTANLSLLSVVMSCWF